jgi:nitrate/TMAO reductase-like tetraheme cytochrome c subunit
VKGSRALFLAALLLGGCSVPVPFAEGWLFRTSRAQLPESRDCQRCHGEIFEEWKESPHAQAWTADAFVAFTGEYAARDCLDCHAPGPLGASGEVRLRDVHLNEGVTCISCHLSADPQAEPLTMRGPHARTTPIEVHPVVEDPLFQKAELCGTCHETVLSEWQESPEPRDGSEKEICQGCHMQRVVRRMESYDAEHPYSAVLVVLSEPVEGRRHRFEVPEEPWEDIELRAKPAIQGRPAEVVVTNGLPHAIPTGGYGRRIARLRIRWPGGEATETLRADLDQAIGAGQTRAFAFPDVPSGVVPDAVLERRNPRSGEFERLAPAPGPGDAW